MNNPQKANTRSTFSMAKTVNQNTTRPNLVEASTGCQLETICLRAPLCGGQRVRPRLPATSSNRVNTRDHAHTTITQTI